MATCVVAALVLASPPVEASSGVLRGGLYVSSLAWVVAGSLSVALTPSPTPSPTLDCASAIANISAAAPCETEDGACPGACGILSRRVLESCRGVAIDSLPTGPLLAVVQPISILGSFIFGDSPVITGSPCIGVVLDSALQLPAPDCADPVDLLFNSVLRHSMCIIRLPSCPQVCLDIIDAVFELCEVSEHVAITAVDAGFAAIDEVQSGEFMGLMTTEVAPGVTNVTAPVRSFIDVIIEVLSPPCVAAVFARHNENVTPAPSPSQGATPAPLPGPDATPAPSPTYPGSNSADCEKEYLNAQLTDNLYGFCSRCSGAGGQEPLMSRCQLCWEACRCGCQVP